MKVGESLVCYIFAQQKLCFKIWSLVHYVCVSLSVYSAEAVAAAARGQVTCHGT